MAVIKSRISFFAEDFGLIKQYLTAEEIVEMISAVQDLCIFGNTEYIPQTQKQQYCWDKMKDAFDKDLKNYQTAVENGKKGGRPKVKNKSITQEETQNITQSKSSLTLDSYNPLKENSLKGVKENSPLNTEVVPIEKYAFDGKVIHLKQKDFDVWKKAYPSVNLDKELLSRDVWLAKQTPEVQKNWFVSTSYYLSNLDAKMRDAVDGRAEVYAAYQKLGIKYGGENL